MTRSRGYAITQGPEGVIELDTITCAHCNAIQSIQPYSRPEDVGGLCRACFGLICPKCVARGICDPVEKKLDRVEKANDMSMWFV